LKLKLLILATIYFSISSYAATPTGHLKVIKNRGYLLCGVGGELPGFSIQTNSGKWEGLDVDICRVVATAIFGNPAQVKFITANLQNRFELLLNGDIDLLSRNTSLTLTRDTAIGISFSPTVYYDGQAFLTKKKSNISSIYKLPKGSSICLKRETTHTENLRSFFTRAGMSYPLIVLPNWQQVITHFNTGKCNVVSEDLSALVARLVNQAYSNKYQILPDVISKEPLSPAVRSNAPLFAKVVKWAIHSLVAAEEMGINSKNLRAKIKSKDPLIKRFFGITPGNGAALHLPENWIFLIIKKMGNYGEIFDRNIGKGSPLKLQRGLNDLWKSGGLMYAPPFR
jgi:general L-amino acid transport system substrate-binding protein